MPALAPGQVSLRVYPYPIAADAIVERARVEARIAEAAGFDGLMTSEHHGGFPGYVPNPLQLAGWLLEATERIWAASCPLLLPLQHWSHVAEQVAWQAARFPDRVGVGFAIGGLDRDFELADLDYEARLPRFREGLPKIVAALRGEAEGPLAEDAALAACGVRPVPMVSAAQSPGAARRAARVGVGLLYDSLQTLDRMSEVSRAYAEAGGRGVRIAIRRVWLGPPPEAEARAQLDFYKGYAAQSAQVHWGSGDEMITSESPDGIVEGLLATLERGGCDALNLRVHVKGVAPERIEEQIARVGEEVLPKLRAAWPAA